MTNSLFLLRCYVNVQMMPQGIRRKRTSRKQCAFSLGELLVVVAIIGILTAMILPAIYRGLSRSRESACASNLRQIGLAVLTYASDNDGNLPPSFDLSTGNAWSKIMRNAGYLPQDTTASTYLCPEAYRIYRRKITSPQPCTYSFNAYIGPSYGTCLVRLVQATRPMLTMLAIDGVFSSNLGYWNSVMFPAYQWDQVQHQQGVNVLFLDGHVENWALAAIVHVPANSADSRLFWFGSETLYKAN